jgi:hypothetical protein
VVSTRTLIEINHDRLHQLIDRPELMRLFLEELGTSQHNAPMNEANARGHALDVGHGILIVHQYHHSTDVTVKTEYAEIKL